MTGEWPIRKPIRLLYWYDQDIYFVREVMRKNQENSWPSEIHASIRLIVGRPGFNSRAESDQKTLKVGIHNFPA